jgi:hypothetical protein
LSGRDSPTAPLPEVSFKNVRVILVEGKDAKELDGVLLLRAGDLVVNPTRPGSPLRTMRYREISAVAHEQKQVTGLLSKRTRYFLNIDTPSEKVVLRVEKGDLDAIIQAIEARTGLAVSRPPAK